MWPLTCPCTGHRLLANDVRPLHGYVCQRRHSFACVSGRKSPVVKGLTIAGLLVVLCVVTLVVTFGFQDPTDTSTSTSVAVTSETIVLKDTQLERDLDPLSATSIINTQSNLAPFWSTSRTDDLNPFTTSPVSVVTRGVHRLPDADALYRDIRLQRVKGFAPHSIQYDDTHYYIVSVKIMWSLPYRLLPQGCIIVGHEKATGLPDRYVFFSNTFQVNPSINGTFAIDRINGFLYVMVKPTVTNAPILIRTGPTEQDVLGYIDPNSSNSDARYLIRVPITPGEIPTTATTQNSNNNTNPNIRTVAISGLPGGYNPYFECDDSGALYVTVGGGSNGDIDVIDATSFPAFTLTKRIPYIANQSALICFDPNGNLTWINVIFNSYSIMNLACHSTSVAIAIDVNNSNSNVNMSTHVANSSSTVVEYQSETPVLSSTTLRAKIVIIFSADQGLPVKYCHVVTEGYLTALRLACPVSTSDQLVVGYHSTSGSYITRWRAVVAVTDPPASQITPSP
jgi:hypothetical protein